MMWMVRVVINGPDLRRRGILSTVFRRYAYREYLGDQCTHENRPSWPTIGTATEPPGPRFLASAAVVHEDMTVRSGEQRRDAAANGRPAQAAPARGASAPPPASQNRPGRTT